MQLSKTPIEGCHLLVPKTFKDERGHFFESFNQRIFEEAVGQKVRFVQENQSFSVKGVLRGLHFQKGAHAQAKLVRVAHGKVLDVVVDLRTESPSFGKVFSHILTAKDRTQLFVPRGCAHGFVTLSKTALFLYKCDNYYHPQAEGGIIYNDAQLGIDWHLPEKALILSKKDRALPPFNALKELGTI